MDKKTNLTQRLRKKLLERMERETEITDEKILEMIDALILQEGRETYVSLPAEARAADGAV